MMSALQHAEERALISEVVIILILNNRRQQKKSEERREHKNEKTKYAATIYRAGEHHLGRIAKAADQPQTCTARFFAHSTSNRWQ
jgi:hypothetical protein